MASELVDELVRVASAETGVLEESIWGQPHARRGRQDASTARQAIYFALRDSGWPYETIAAEFSRNHATVHHGVARIALAIRNDRDLRFLVDKLAETIAAYQGRTRMTHDVRASIERMDREIVWARQLALQLTERIDTLQQARGALMQVVDPVVTRALQAVV